MAPSKDKQLFIALDPQRRRIELVVDWTEEDEQRQQSNPNLSTTNVVKQREVKKEEESSNTAATTSNQKNEKANFRESNNPVSLAPIAELAPGNVESKNSGGTADLLPKERSKATFDVLTMTNILDGGPEKTARRRFIASPTEGHDLSDKYSWDRAALLRASLKLFMDVHTEYRGKIHPTRDDMRWMSDNMMLSGGMSGPASLATPTVRSQATEEQVKWWVPKIINNEMICVYAQTEIGHGSNVRGLRTTATYDKATKEFIIDTPVLSATKAWISGVGRVILVPHQHHSLKKNFS